MSCSPLGPNASHRIISWGACPAHIALALLLTKAKWVYDKMCLLKKQHFCLLSIYKWHNKKVHPFTYPYLGWGLYRFQPGHLACCPGLAGPLCSHWYGTGNGSVHSPRPASHCGRNTHVTVTFMLVIEWFILFMWEVQQRLSDENEISYLVADVERWDIGLVNVIRHSISSPARNTGPRAIEATTSIIWHGWRQNRHESQSMYEIRRR